MRRKKHSTVISKFTKPIYLICSLGERSRIKGNSIDYAVMEKTSKGKVVKLDAGWSDVGSWNALYDIGPKDGDANVKKVR